jgi:hypothetical protein
MSGFIEQALNPPHKLEAIGSAAIFWSNRNDMIQVLIEPVGHAE